MFVPPAAMFRKSAPEEKIPVLLSPVNVYDGAPAEPSGAMNVPLEEMLPVAEIVLLELIAPPALIEPLTPTPPVTTSAPEDVPADAAPDVMFTEPVPAAASRLMLPPEFATEVIPLRVPLAPAPSCDSAPV